MPQRNEQSEDLLSPEVVRAFWDRLNMQARQVYYLHDIALSARRIAKALETLNKLQ